MLEIIVFSSSYFVGNRLVTTFFLEGLTPTEKFASFKSNFFQFTVGRNELLIPLLIAFLAVFFLFHNKDNRKFKEGSEHGTARWSESGTATPFMNENPQENILLSKTEGVRVSGKAKQPKNNRNANVFVEGGSGTGKTRFFVTPNLLQAYGTYIVTDPKGTILDSVGSFLIKSGYNVKVMNLKDSESIRHLSMHYNPFEYIDSELDILSLAETLMKNTSNKKGQAGDPFWENAEKLMYMAFIGYIHYYCPKEEQTFNTLYYMVIKSRIDESNPNKKNPIDIVFDELREEKGDQEFCIMQYDAFKLAPPKTALSILISASARLAPFAIGELKELVASDDLELRNLADNKTALFLITSDSDPVLNFLIGILYTQLFVHLMRRADNDYNGFLPRPVRCILDEFPNICLIPNFEKLLAVIRSRNISASVIVQTRSQLKTDYKDTMNTIVGNCDSYLFLGTNDDKEAKEFSESFGKETIYKKSTGENTNGKSQKGSSKNIDTMGVSLIAQNEIMAMDGGKCILRIRGKDPFFSDKYPLEEHPNYKYLATDTENLFDVEKFITSYKNKKTSVFTKISVAQSQAVVKALKQAQMISLDER